MPRLSSHSKELLVLGLGLQLALTSYDQRSVPLYDVLIQNKDLYDDLGKPPIKADIAIAGDRIMKISKIENERARRLIDATGQTIAPGFINILS